jgi:hypothetical protein
MDIPGDMVPGVLDGIFDQYCFSPRRLTHAVATRWIPPPVSLRFPLSLQPTDAFRVMVSFLASDCCHHDADTQRVLAADTEFDIISASPG